MAKALKKQAAKANPKATLNDLPGRLCMDWTDGRGVISVETKGSTQNHPAPLKLPVFIPGESVVRVKPEKGAGFTIGVVASGDFTVTPGADSTAAFPFQPMVGDRPMVVKAKQWLRGGDTGLSSQAMCRALTGVDTRSDADGIGFLHEASARSDDSSYHPHDAADFGRCVRFLQAVPEARERLDTLRLMSPTWDALVTAWPSLETIYEGDRTAGPGTEPSFYPAIQKILAPFVAKVRRRTP